MRAVTLPKLQGRLEANWDNAAGVLQASRDARSLEETLGTQHETLIDQLNAYRKLIEFSIPVDEKDKVTESILIRPHRFHPEQARLWHDLLYKPDVRFLVVPAGRRSGKTEVFKRWLLWALLDPANLGNPEPAEYFAAAPVMPQAKRLYWEWSWRPCWTAMAPLGSTRITRSPVDL